MSNLKTSRYPSLQGNSVEAPRENYIKLLQTARNLGYSKTVVDACVSENCSKVSVDSYDSLPVSTKKTESDSALTNSLPPQPLMPTNIQPFVSNTQNNINHNNYAFNNSDLADTNGIFNGYNMNQMNIHSRTQNFLQRQVGQPSPLLPNFLGMATCGLIHPGPISQPTFRTCKIDDCDAPVHGRKPYCVKHRGNRRCEHFGCTKCAQGTTRFCIAHGGGRRCTYPGCDKGARDKSFCAAHGGGKRCTFLDCTKAAVGDSLCTAHGGGKRCDVEGCSKAAQASTKFCVKHGGGRKCSAPGCEKVARGRTNFCASHGGSVICKIEGCNRAAIRRCQLCRKHGQASNSAERKAIVSAS